MLMDSSTNLITDNSEGHYCSYHGGECFYNRGLNYTCRNNLPPGNTDLANDFLFHLLFEVHEIFGPFCMSIIMTKRFALLMENF